MKHLIVIRHAKSSWLDLNLPDIGRPLNQRGERDAPSAGQRLKHWGLVPDCIVSSPAVRARTTAELIAAATGYEPTRILVRPEIYEHGMSGLLTVIHELDDNWQRVFLIGHNPDLTYLVNWLSNEDVTHLPTCGVASIECAVDNWSHIMEGAGQLRLFDYPKKHTGQD